MKRLKPSRRTLATVVVIALIFGGLYYNQRQGLRRVAVETHNALCALKGDLEQRTANAEKYLHDVRTGQRVPVRGITNAEVQQSIRDRRATLQALAPLTCE